jgi:hypothetical protein
VVDAEEAAAGGADAHLLRGGPAEAQVDHLHAGRLEEAAQLRPRPVAGERGHEDHLPPVTGGQQRGEAGTPGTGPGHRRVDHGHRGVRGEAVDRALEVAVEEGVAQHDERGTHRTGSRPWRADDAPTATSTAAHRRWTAT